MDSIIYVCRSFKYIEFLFNWASEVRGYSIAEFEIKAYLTMFEDNESHYKLHWVLLRCNIYSNLADKE